MIGLGLAAPELAAQARVLPLARFAAFPALAAAYAAGRALISFIGDSTTFGLGAGSGGFYSSSNGAYALSPTRRLIEGLNARGVTAIDGCASYGARNAFTAATMVPAYFGSGVALDSNYVFSGSWTHASGWGQFAGSNSGGKVSFAPGFTWDRAEVFEAAPIGISDAIVTLDIGGTAIDSYRVGVAGGPGGGLAKRTITAPRGPNTLYARNGGGYLGVGGIRCWDSTTRHVQVENLGNPGWQASDAVAAAYHYSALNLVPLYGAHLFVINLGLNDRYYGRTAAAFKADLKTLANACKATGANVLLAIPHPGINGTAYNLDAAFVAAIVDAAAELALPAPIDLRAAGLVPADYYDDIHLLASGYAKIGAAYAARLLG